MKYLRTLQNILWDFEKLEHGWQISHIIKQIH